MKGAPMVGDTLKANIRVNKDGQVMGGYHEGFASLDEGDTWYEAEVVLRRVVARGPL